jgi:Region found in RelA / SpoT proteins
LTAHENGANVSPYDRGLVYRSATAIAGDEIDNLELNQEDVTDYPRSQYSPEQVARAGAVIASDLAISSGQVPADVRDAFLIANNWRDAHAYPMRSIRQSLHHHVRANDLEAITAARLKRMQAIRRKLRRINVKLHKLQDLGGCRVILATIAQTRTLVGILKEKLCSTVIKENDYISAPKIDGYRSHHLVFSFRRPKQTPFDGKRIEVQIRTHLQHSWATTVEAVGLFRGEELKNQKGDKDWLTFFALMSAEFAEAEKCASVPGTPDSDERKREIKKLAKSLDALTVLESVTNGFQGTDIALAPGYKPSHFLIRFDHSTKTVHVEPYNKAAKATVSYDKAEETQRAGDQNDVVVLVEVDKINNLKAAYPNYFGDVELFRSQLNQIVHGGGGCGVCATAKTASEEAGARTSWRSFMVARYSLPKAEYH